MKLSIQTYKIVSEDTTEPITVTQVKDALHITCDDDDAYIESLITAARQMVETGTSRVLVPKSFELYQDELSTNNSVVDNSIIDLLMVPVTAISKFEYIEGSTTNGTYTTLATTEYQTDIISEPARIYLEQFPNVKDNTLNAVKITFAAGYASGSVPEALTQAMMLIVGHWYENRQDVVTGTMVNKIPETSQWLIERYRLQLFR